MPTDAFIRTPDRELPVGSAGFSIERNAGAMEDIARGRPYHALSIWVDPTDDQVPRLVITDADLYLEGEIPDALDGLRLSQDAGGDDFEDAPLPWIRPGSLVGMAEIIYELASAEDDGSWEPDARKYLDGPLSISIDRAGDVWRIEVRASHEGGVGASGAPDFHAVFYSELEIMSYDQ